MKDMEGKSVFIVDFILLILGGLCLLWAHVPITFHSPEFLGILLGIFGVIAFINLICAEMSDLDGYFLMAGINGGIALLILLILIGGAFFSMKAINKSDNRVLVTVEEGDIATLSTIDQAKFASVDMQNAEMLGDRKAGAIENATWYDVDDEYNLIAINKIGSVEYYRISALDYGGFWKYRKAKDVGVKGYVLVNCETQEAHLVKLDQGMQYTPGAYFAKNLHRHLFYQYPSTFFGKSYFEVDDAGHPYYVTSVKETTAGLFGALKVTGFCITDPITGESTMYNQDNLPEWVDHAYELSYLMDGVQRKYNYVGSNWNLITSKTGVNRTSYSYNDDAFAGYSSVINADGDVAFFTGVTPYNRAETVVGFLYADVRTGKITFYNLAGCAEESSAMAAARGLVQEKRYTASYPQLVNVDGYPTYLMTLKDEAGLIQRYAMVYAESTAVAVQGETLDKCQRLYRNRMASLDGNIEEAIETSYTIGKITAIERAEVEGYTYFFFTIEGSDEIYMSSIEAAYKQVFFKPGDTIEFIESERYEDGIHLITQIK